MSKKIIVGVIVIILAASMLAGLLNFMNMGSNNTEQTQETAEEDKEIKAALQGYFSNIKKGDLNQAYNYTANSMSDIFDLQRKKEEFEEETKDLTDERALKAANEYFQHCIQNTIREYKIESIDAGDDKATALVRVDMVDSDQVEEFKVEEVQKKVDKYIEDHQEELLKISNEQGEEALNKEFDVLQNMYAYQLMDDKMNNAPTLSDAVKVNLIKTEEGWKITSISQAS